MIRKITDKIKLPESTRIPFFGGWWYRVMLAIDNRSIVKEKLPENPLNTEERDEKITASLTSFPARIEYVAATSSPAWWTECIAGTTKAAMR